MEISPFTSIRKCDVMKAAHIPAYLSGKKKRVSGPCLPPCFNLAKIQSHSGLVRTLFVFPPTPLPTWVHTPQLHYTFKEEGRERKKKGGDKYPDSICAPSLELNATSHKSLSTFISFEGHFVSGMALTHPPRIPKQKPYRFSKYSTNGHRTHEREKIVLNGSTRCCTAHCCLANSVS